MLVLVQKVLQIQVFKALVLFNIILIYNRKVWEEYLDLTQECFLYNHLNSQQEVVQIHRSNY